MGMGGVTPPLQKQMKLKEESETMSVDEAPIMKSTPLHIAQREEKQKALQEKGPTVAIVVPMLPKIAKDAPEYIMPSEDWTKCMRYMAGQRKPGQLYSTQAIEAEILLSEALDKLEPCKRIDEAAWEGFKGHTIYMAEKIEKEEQVGLGLPQAVKEELPSSPDMLIKVEQSLTMPCQKDETSSMEGRQWNAIERLTNPLIMTEETSASLSNRTNKKKDRVVLQCYHNEELRMKGETTMPDQGIVFDGSREPRQMRPRQKIKKRGF